MEVTEEIEEAEETKRAGKNEEIEDGKDDEETKTQNKITKEAEEEYKNVTENYKISFEPI